VRQHLLAHRAVLDVLDDVGNVLRVFGELRRELLLNRRPERGERLCPLGLLRQVECLRHPGFCELLHARHQPRRRLDLGPFHLGLLHFGDQLARRVEQLADALLRDLEALHDLGLGELQRPPLHHHDRVLPAGHDHVHVRELELLEGGIEDPRALDPPHAHGGDGAVPRHLGHGERGGGRGNAQHVGVVLLVRREHVDENLDLVLEAFGKERADRAVGHPRREDLLVGRPPLALQKAAGDLAGGVALLAVFDGQRKER